MKNTKAQIPLCIPYIDDFEISAVAQVLRSGWLAHGPQNKKFEESFAQYIGVKRAVSLNSCTSALHLAIEALGIKGEVIVPSFTFVASANAVLTAGATPVFADVLYDTCNVDPDDIERKITPRTEAIMPVHYAGQSCDMDRILEIAGKRNLTIIEDSAETIGGEYKGKKTGSFGTGCFSFFPTKNLTTGEGGMLTTDNDELADKVKALSGHGISSTTFARQKSEKPWFRSASFLGYNFRMSNILAAIGVEQMKKLEAANQKRREYAAYLNAHLKDVEEIDLPVESACCKHVYQMYTIKVKKGINRDKVVRELIAKGIGASVHFDPPVHKQQYYVEKGYGDIDLPITVKLSNSIITLPMYPQMTKIDLENLVKAIRDIIVREKCSV